MTMFKKLTTAAALVAITTISPACSTVSSIIGGVTTVSGGGGVQCSLPTKVAKSYYLEEAGYQGILLSLNSLVDSGVIVKGSAVSIQARDILSQRLIPLHAAVGKAVDACDASQLDKQVQAATEAIVDLQVLIGKAKASS